MSNQKHTVSTDALDTLGTYPIPENSGRDAIHLAVEPVVAGELLYGGQFIRLDGNIAFITYADSAVGIVDPFITGGVKEGERFWLVVLPRTITSLRHVWSHPAFPEAQSVADNDPHYVFHVDVSETVSKADMARFMDEVRESVPAPDPEQSMAVAWLKDYCREQLDERYEYIMEGAKRYLDAGDYLYGEADSGKFDNIDLDVGEFWEHYTKATKTEVPEVDRHNFFSCGC